MAASFAYFTAGVLVDTLIGAFDRVENELAKFFINYLNACRMLSRTCMHSRAAACRMPPCECVRARAMLAIACVPACVRARVPSRSVGTGSRSVGPDLVVE